MAVFAAEKSDQKAINQFHSAIVAVQTDTVRRLMQWQMPEELMTICTGADLLTIELIEANLEGRLLEFFDSESQDVLS